MSALRDAMMSELCSFSNKKKKAALSAQVCTFGEINKKTRVFFFLPVAYYTTASLLASYQLHRRAVKQTSPWTRAPRIHFQRDASTKKALRSSADASPTWERRRRTAGVGKQTWQQQQR